MTVSTDALLLGWEAILPGTAIGGRWVFEKAQAHINLLELKAAYLKLSGLFKSSTPVAHGSIYEQEWGDTITCIVDTSHRPMGSGPERVQQNISRHIQRSSGHGISSFQQSLRVDALKRDLPENHPSVLSSSSGPV